MRSGRVQLSWWGQDLAWEGVGITGALGSTEGPGVLGRWLRELGSAGP